MSRWIVAHLRKVGLQRMENDGVDKGDVESKQNSDIDNLRFSLATMIQEVTSQHNLMTSNIWTIGQISGVIIAFVSVIFIETIAQNINQTWMIITLIFLGISFFIGLYVLISTIQVSLGSDVEEICSLNPHSPRSLLDSKTKTNLMVVSLLF